MKFKVRLVNVQVDQRNPKLALDTAAALIVFYEQTMLNTKIDDSSRLN